MHPCNHSLSILLILPIPSSQLLSSSMLLVLWLPELHGSTDVALQFHATHFSMLLELFCSTVAVPQSFAAPQVWLLAP